MWLLVVFAIAAGAMIAVQTGVNAQLGRSLGSATLAALVSFAVGTAALLAFALATREAAPAREALAAAPWWAWTGGVLGAVFVASVIAIAPRLGATAVLSAVIAGQLASALALDHYGWLGFAERAVTPMRAVGVAMLAVGAAIVRIY